MDTNRDAHVAAVLSLLGQGPAPRSSRPPRQDAATFSNFGPRLGAMRRAGAERAGSFGAAVSRYLLTQRVELFDGTGPTGVAVAGAASRTARCTERDRAGAERASPLPGQVRRRPVQIARCTSWPGTWPSRPYPGDQPNKVVRCLKRYVAREFPPGPTREHVVRGWLGHPVMRVRNHPAGRTVLRPGDARSSSGSWSSPFGARGSAGGRACFRRPSSRCPATATPARCRRHRPSAIGEMLADEASAGTGPAVGRKRGRGKLADARAS